MEHHGEHNENIDKQGYSTHCLPHPWPLLRILCIPSTQSSKSSVRTAGCGLTRHFRLRFCLKRHRGSRQLVVLLGLGAHDGGLDRQLCRCREQDGRAEETGLGGRPTETATLQLLETERDSAPGGQLVLRAHLSVSRSGLYLLSMRSAFTMSGHWSSLGRLSGFCLQRNFGWKRGGTG